MRTGLLFAPALLFSFTIVSSGRAEDWSQWRGPRRDGSAKLTTPKTWPRELKKVWEANVGQGHASPVVAGGRAYVLARQGEDEVFLALNLADGKQVFRHAYGAPYKTNPAAEGHGKGPKSTPVVADGKVVTLGISGIVTCWDARGDGKPLWQKEFSKRFAATSPLYGSAMSPLVLGKSCIAHVGGHNSGALVALALADGSQQWAWGDDGPGYASPVLARIGGQEQLITQSQNACIAVSPTTGKLLWKFDLATEYAQNSITPLVIGDRVIFGGYNQPTFAVQVTKSGDTWTAKRQWANADIPMYMSSPVTSGKAFFGMTHRRSGQLFCADIETGKVLWTGKPRLGDNAALLITGDVLLVLTTESQLLVVKNTIEGYQELVRYRLAETPTWAHPAIVEPDKILIKDQEKVTLWSL
jgi:outer membrane protein assembly factor BamB